MWNGDALPISKEPGSKSAEPYRHVEASTQQ